MKPLKILKIFFEMENNRINEYVYYLHELHQIKSKVGPGLYRIQGCVSGMRKIATEDTLSPSNIKMIADNSWSSPRQKWTGEG